MNLLFQPGLRRASAFICAAVLWTGVSLRAAPSGENHAYAVAVKAFQDAMWDRAEVLLEQFRETFPDSTNTPQAVLLEAQAKINQGKFTNSVALLRGHLAKTGTLADQYWFWIGEAQFQAGDYGAAADTFAKVSGPEFPTSTRRLEANVREAEARAKLGQWAQVVDLLQKPDGAFQQAAKVNPNNEFAVRGRLLLAEAGFEQKNYPQAEAALQPLAKEPLSIDQNWQRQYLLCRIQRSAGRLEDARQSSAVLVTFAEGTARPELLAEAIALHAEILEQLGQWENATAAFKRNLAPQTPSELQRQAWFKVAELALTQGGLTNAVATLETYLSQFPDSPNADIALLTLGELHLKQYVALGVTNATLAGSNQLQQALGLFDRLINTFSNSTLLGKAELDRGWSLWVNGNIPESLAAFKAAAGRLPPSADLAVARFKLADAQFALKDFGDALTNYHGALEAAAGLPRVQAALTTPALYQMVQASLGMTNLAAAEDAMRQILHSDPHSAATNGTVLLVGQGYADVQKPDQARQLLEEFLKRFPDSSLRPEVELAIAHTLEQAANWNAAITQYDSWLNQFSTNRLRPEAEFGRALANYYAGNYSNTLAQFTKFVAQFPTNDLAPQAQLWLADYYYNRGEYLEAEKNYQLIFQTWPASDLAFKARMMAGRAAVGRQDYSAAIRYFTMLTSDTNCPSGLWIEAMFAYGGSLMFRNSGVSNNPTADLNVAVGVFGTIRDKYPNTRDAAQALGALGECYFQLGASAPNNYLLATNVYQQVINLPQSSVAARSQAQIGLGLTLEKMAQGRTAAEQLALLKLARDNYVDVFHEANLHGDEKPDPFSVKRAGMETLRLLESGPLQDWDQLVKVCERLQTMLPPLKPRLEKVIARAKEHLPQEKN